MIEPTQGNLLEAHTEALVNTVNTEGVMGKGIALQFRQAYPEMFRAYVHDCRHRKVRLGQMHVFDLGGLVGGPRWIINFPTKAHWKSGSRLDDIKVGLADLVEKVRQLEIKSIALPPLGCGYGGLNWSDVYPLIVSAFSKIPAVKVLVFAPVSVPTPAAMPNRTERPKMTAGQAALIALLDRYLKGMLDPVVSLLEVHKLMYFLKSAGEPLPKLVFTKGLFGPYAPNLRHSLIRMEHHYTQGYGAGKDSPETALELLPGATEAAEAFLADKPETKTRMDEVATLIQGYEDPYGMELLSSVHWVMQNDPATIKDADAAATAVHQWNTRKKNLLKVEHLEKAWQRLRDLGWPRHLPV